MLESIILGIIQGVAEWLPVSSEGMIVLARIHLFESTSNLHEHIAYALFLHIGTLLAACIYFRKDLIRLASVLLGKNRKDRPTFIFLLISTFVSGVLGILLIQATKHLETTSILSGNVIMLAIGILLIMTAALQLRQPNTPRKTGRSSTPLDALLTGFAQGFSILPGLSRSGLTVAMLIFRGFKETSALRLSFLMSIPIVLGGNIVLNAKDLTLTAPLVAALISAFITGLITIHLLLAFARNINIAYFTFFIGALTIASVFL